MSNTHWLRLLVVQMLAAISIPAGAEATTEPSSPPALETDAVVQPPALESAFKHYRRHDPAPDARDWRAANDEVGRLGGFMGHMAPHPDERTQPGATSK